MAGFEGIHVSDITIVAFLKDWSDGEFAKEVMRAATGKAAKYVSHARKWARENPAEYEKYSSKVKYYPSSDSVEVPVEMWAPDKTKKFMTVLYSLVFTFFQSLRKTFANLNCNIFSIKTPTFFYIKFA